VSRQDGTQSPRTSHESRHTDATGFVRSATQCCSRGWRAAHRRVCEVAVIVKTHELDHRTGLLLLGGLPGELTQDWIPVGDVHLNDAVRVDPGLVGNGSGALKRPIPVRDLERGVGDLGANGV
jgi:hypothetical protein